MKKKLTAISILITISMLGIIYFQLDWMNNEMQNVKRDLSMHSGYALNWAIVNRVVEYDKKNILADSLRVHFKNLYNTTIVNRKMYPDSVDIYMTERVTRRLSFLYGKKYWSIGGRSTIIKDSAEAVKKDKLDKRFELLPSDQRYQLKKRIGRLSLYLPVRKNQDLKFIVKDLRAVKLFDSLFSDKTDYCRPLYTRTDSLEIIRHVKKQLAKEGRSEFNNKLRLRFYCTPSQLGTYWESGTSIAQEYTPLGLASYASNPGVNKKWVSVYFKSINPLIFQKIIRTVAISATWILLAIIGFIYLFVTILKQKRLADMKDDFINNMTHELKTPIAIISAAVEGMQNFNVLQDKEKTNRYLETSRKELNRLNELVTKVLHMASFEKRDIYLTIDTINLDELMQEVIESFKMHSNKTVNIAYKNLSAVKTFRADRVHFRNTISNLIDNAIKYSGELPEIYINCLMENNNLKISIADKGIGIPFSQQKLIFEKFHRVPSGNVHNIKGTGLGLSYVKYIVEMHGGSVSIKSELNKGSEFIISLPLTA